MATVTLKINGGDKLRATLQRMASRLSAPGTLRVGFLEGATYPATRGQSGLHVATVAFWNEFGTARMPPRPFFRRMIAAKSPGWAAALAKIAKATQYNALASLKLMGTGIKDQLVKSINDFSDPPLAASTIARKGFAKPLIDTGVMIRSVDFEVKTS